MLSKYTLLSLGIGTFFLVFTARSFADNSVQFNIQHLELKTKQPLSSPTPPPPTSTPAIKVTKINLPIVDKDYVLETQTITQASLGVSPSFLLFSDLSPTNPQLQKSQLQVEAIGLQPLTLSVYTEGDLASEDKSLIIPATTCDSGSCSNTNADIWNNSLTYGFGYRCESNTLFCKQLNPQPEDYLSLPNSLNKAWQQETEIINTHKEFSYMYKVNVSPTQQKATYATQIIYLLTPKL